MPVLVAAVAEARAFWRWQLEGCPRARGGGGCAAAAKCSTLGGAPSAARGVRRCGAQVQACVQAVQRRVYSEVGEGVAGTVPGGGAAVHIARCGAAVSSLDCS